MVNDGEALQTPKEKPKPLRVPQQEPVTNHMVGGLFSFWKLNEVSTVIFPITFRHLLLENAHRHGRHVSTQYADYPTPIFVFNIDDRQVTR